jgi:acetyltransferase-like isoleucine patch superfamily enzyme
VKSVLKRQLGRKRADIEMAIVFVVSKLPVHRLRILALRALGAELSDTVVLYHGFEVREPRKLVVGDRSNIGDHAILDARGGLRIGVDVNFSTAVSIWTAQHDWTSDDFAYETAPVEIGDRVWLGPRVTVLPGTTIGEGAVVAAGAVATGELAPFTLYGGVPAKKLGDRPTSLSYRLPEPKGKLWWW